jgi:hypothetical protein
MVGKTTTEYVIIQTTITMQNGKIDEVCKITQKSSPLSEKFKRILKDDYAIEEKKL